MEHRENFSCCAFGYARYGQIGSDFPSFTKVPQQVPIKEPVFSISAGDSHSAILTETYKIYTFGKNSFGQLGLGHFSPVPGPTLVSFLQAKKVDSIICGAEHTFAVTNEGEIFSWGLNIKGQLGLGDVLNRNSPTLIESISSKMSQFQGSNLERNEKVSQVACGGLHSVILTDRNRVLACGQGAFGAVGLVSNENFLRFVSVKNLEGLGKIEKIQAGLAFSAAIAQGNLYVWGKIGQSSGISQVLFEGKSSSPRTGRVEDVSCADGVLICIVKGQVWVYGDGFGANGKEPVRLNCEKQVKYVSCGCEHAACISFDNKICMWGKSQFGQCSDIQDSFQPVFLSLFSEISTYKVACGSYHTILLTDRPLSQEAKQEVHSSKYLTPYFEVNYSELTINPEPIGRGGYGTVFKGRWRGTPVAVKKMKLIEKYNEFLQECQTMMSVRHPNIVLFMGACTVKPNLCIILEFCGNGSLWDVLRNHSVPLPWYLRCKISLDIARGVNYLHNFPTAVLHRDLKSLNILIDDAMNAKLADFGWTRFKAENMTNKIGTYQWMAPEVIQGQQYSEKADVYSFGIILWELATRKPPFKELTGLQVSQEVVHSNLRPCLPKRCPEPFLKLMQRCWDRDCESRPSFSLIIEELEDFLKFLEKNAIN